MCEVIEVLCCFFGSGVARSKKKSVSVCSVLEANKEDPNTLGITLCSVEEEREIPPPVT